MGTRIQAVPEKIVRFTQTFFRIVPLILVCTYFFAYAYGMFTVPSGSMLPTLQINGSGMFKYIDPKELEYDDVVLFFPAEVPENGIKNGFERLAFQRQTHQQLLVKRVIGLEGDVIEVRDGYAWRNGEKLDSSYLTTSTDGSFAPYTVPEGHIFVMGDNRNHSVDSRYFGAFDRRAFFGRMVFMFPFH